MASSHGFGNDHRWGNDEKGPQKGVPLANQFQKLPSSVTGHLSSQSTARDEAQDQTAKHNVQDHRGSPFQARLGHLDMFAPHGMGCFGMPMVPPMPLIQPIPGVMPGVPGMGWFNSMPGRFGRDMLGRGEQLFSSKVQVFTMMSQTLLDPEVLVRGDCYDV